MVRVLTIGFWFCITVVNILFVAEFVGHSTRLSLSLLMIAIFAAVMLFRLGDNWRDVFAALGVAAACNMSTGKPRAYSAYGQPDLVLPARR